MNGEPIFGSFNEEELEKFSQEKIRIEKLLKGKGDIVCQMEKVW